MSSSSRKKLDEKHLKVLRMLASSNCNKYCFDCRQRGPTYVNVTIGSFVCTKCSGILRGLTPPHRVKSISMATFTQEEVDQLMTKGNEHCRKVWLALCENEPSTKDEQQIKDFMIDKYEKKRYYVEPSIAMKMSSFNGLSNSSQNNTTLHATIPPPTTSSNNTSNNHITKAKLELNNGENNNIKLYTNGNAQPQRGLVDPFSPTQPQTQTSFANFDNATIFNATSTVPDIFGLDLLSCNNQPKYYHHYLCNYSNIGAENKTSDQTSQNSAQPSGPPFLRCHRKPQPSYSHTNRWSTGSVMMSPSLSSNNSNVPTEDRYAALKDLDTIMKSQKQQNTVQQSNGTHSEVNTVPHTTPLQPTDPWGNSLASSPPVNGGLWNQVVKENGHNNMMNGFTSNPFANDAWGSESSLAMDSTRNPFKNSKLFSDWPGTNGSSEMTTSQSMGAFQWMSQANSSRPNPFAANGFSGSPPNNSAYHSSNPFL